MNQDKKVSQAYDIIGDIHGHAAELEALLHKLGYSEEEGCFRHPEGRKVVFLGDYIDRGPEIRRVLQIVRAMIDAGEAQGILGNHEVNALWYHHQDKDGQYLRAHGPGIKKQHIASLEQIARPQPNEWKAWLDWMAGLPLWLDFGVFRVVHACWAAENIQALEGIDLRNFDDLVKYSRKGSKENQLLRPLLNGPELELPEGVVFMAHGGKKCEEIRYKWWEPLEGLSYRRALYPGHDPGLPDMLIENPPSSNSVAPEDPIMFFGHYAILEEKPAPILPNLACLDYGCGKGGDLVAYRWDGESFLNDSNFVSVSPREASRNGSIEIDRYSSEPNLEGGIE